MTAERTERRDVRVNGFKTVMRIRPSIWTAFQKLTAAKGTNTQAVMSGFRVNNPATDLVPAIETYVAAHSTEPVYQFATREQWLGQIIELMRPIFAARGHKLPERINAAMGFTSKGWKGQTLGECWPASKSAQKWTEIFLKPTLSDPTYIVNILTHELCHAVDDCKSNHGKRFQIIATAMDLEGKAKVMLGDVNGAWGEWAKPIVESVGPMPHAALDEFVAKHKAQKNRQLKCVCDECGTIWRMSATAMKAGLDEAEESDDLEITLKCPVFKCAGTYAVPSDEIDEVPEDEQ